MSYANIAVVIPIKKNEVISKLEEELQKEVDLNFGSLYITLKENCFIQEKGLRQTKYELERILRNKKPFEIEINKLNYNPNKGLFLEVKLNKELKELYSDLFNVLDEGIDKKFLWHRKQGFKPQITIIRPNYWLEEKIGSTNWVEKFEKEFNFKQKVNSFIFLKKDDSKAENFIYGHTYYLDKIAEGMKRDLFRITYDGFDVILGKKIKAKFFRFITRGGAADYAIEALERLEEQNILIIDTTLKVLDEGITKESIDKYLSEEINKKTINRYIELDELYKFCNLQKEKNMKEGKDSSDIVNCIIEGLKRMFSGKVKSAFDVFNSSGETYYKALKNVYLKKEDAKKGLLKELNIFREMCPFLEENKFNTCTIFGVSYLKIIKEGYDRTEKVWGDFIDRVYKGNWDEVTNNLKNYKTKIKDTEQKDKLLKSCSLLSTHEGSC